MSTLTKEIDQKEELRGLDFHPLQNRDLEQTLIYVKLLSYVVMADGKLQEEEKKRFSLIVSNLGMDPEDCLNDMESLQADELEQLCNGLKDPLFQAMLLADAHFVSKIGKDEKKVLDQIVLYCNISSDEVKNLLYLDQLFDSLLNSLDVAGEDSSFSQNDKVSPDSSDNEKLTFSEIIASLKDSSVKDFHDPVARDMALYFFVIMKYKLARINDSIKKCDPAQQKGKYIKTTQTMLDEFVEQHLDSVITDQRENLVNTILKSLEKEKEKKTKMQLAPSVFKQFNKILFDKLPRVKRKRSLAEKNAFEVLRKELKNAHYSIETVKFEEARTGCLAGIIAFFVSGLIVSPWLESHDWVSAIPLIVAVLFWRKNNNSKTLQKKNSVVFDEKLAPAIRSSVKKAISDAIEKSSATIAETHKKQLDQLDQASQAINQVIIKLQKSKEE